MTRIVNILYVALPEISGSTIRSHAMMLAHKDVIGIPEIYVAPTCKGLRGDYEKDGVIYRYLSKGISSSSESQKSLSNLFFKGLQYIVWFVKLYKKIAKNSADVRVIHCHSMFITVIPILLLCVFNPHIKIIYEIRSFWELRIASVVRFKIVRLIENIVAANVSKIVVISAPMKADLVNRGFSSSKIFINRNFVYVNNDLDYKSMNIRRFAYVGNISNIEGIDLLIEAFEDLKLEGAELMIYGNGSELSSLISKYGKEYFYGGFDKSEVESIYEKIDAVVINRRGFEICQKVTPLKPLEAINYNKLLIASDVGGLEDVLKGNEANYISYESDRKTELMKALIEAYNMSTIEIKEKLMSSKTWLNEFRSERSYKKELIGLYEHF